MFFTYCQNRISKYRNNILLLFCNLLILCPATHGQDLAFTIRDTAELQHLIDLSVENSKSHQRIAPDTVKTILKSALILDDTSSFFQYFRKIQMSYYVKNSLHEEAILFIDTCQNMLGNPDTKHGEFYNSLGNHYKVLKFYEEALDHYFKSVEWFEKYDPLTATIPLGNISDIYIQNGDYQKALTYNEQALSYSLQLDNPQKRTYNLVYDYLRIGEIYGTLNNNLQAEAYLKKSIITAKENGRNRLILDAIIANITFYTTLEKYDQCVPLIAEADLICEDPDISNSLQELEYLFEKSKFYLLTNQQEKAVHPDSIHIDNPSLKQETLSYSAFYYARTNEAEKAIAFNEELFREHLRVESQGRMSMLSNIEEKYLNKKLRENNEALLQDIADRKKIVTIIYVAIGLLLCLLVLQLINNRRYKKLNAVLTSVNEDLEVSNKELERFAFVASHDLKTPLREIVSFTGLLERTLQSHENAKVHKYLAFIKAGGKRLDTLISSTLEYSRISFADDNTPEQTVDLDALLGELEKSMGSYLSEKNASINKIDPLPTIKSTVVLEPLFQNLVGNGIKYNVSEAPLIKIYTDQDDSFFSIFIEDNGIGIDEKYQEEIFSMFTRLHTQSEYSGSGLGLAICKRIVEKLNGELRIQSELKQGTTFEIKLPQELIVEQVVASH